MLKEDIFFAKIYNDSEFQVKIHNTTTQKDFKATPDTIAFLDLCTGNSVTEIINTLSERSGETFEDLSQSIEIILTALQEKGLILVRDTPGAGAKVKEIRLRYPLQSAQIEITNRCNLSCLHCYNDSGAPLPDELTTEEIFSVIDGLSSMGAYHVTLSGGEPLMHPDLFEIINYARKAPMSVDIFTNGALITEDTIEEFKKAQIRRFNVSIDSVDESIHDTFRGKKGALRKTLDAVELLKEAGFTLKFSICLSQLTKDGIIDIIRYFRDFNLPDFEIKPVRFSGRGVNGLAVSAEEYYHVLVDVFTYLKRDFPEAIPEICKKTKEACEIARNSIGIKADGTILPCPACDREMAVGNVRDTDLKKLWEGNETLEAIRNTTTENDSTCMKCRYKTYCVGCTAGGFSIGRTLRCCDPDVCTLYRAYDDVFQFLK